MLRQKDDSGINRHLGANASLFMLINLFKNVPRVAVVELQITQKIMPHANPAR